MRIHQPASSSPSTRRRLLATVMLVALVATACGRGDRASEDEFPPGQPIEVTGREVLVKWDLSPSGTLVFAPDSEEDAAAAVTLNDVAIERAVVTVTAFLDKVLTERNLGQTTAIETSGVNAGAFAAAMGMTGPQTDGVLDLQISTATYVIEIGSLGTPGWAQARVESTLIDLTTQDQEPTRRLDTFLFTFDAAGGLELVAVEVAP